MVFVTYFFISLGLAISPGPDIIFLFTQSLQHPLKVGMMVVLGLCTGLLGHMLLALLGVNALVLASPNALILIQAVGAIYLCYLGYKSLLAFWRHENALEQLEGKRLEVSQAREKLFKFYVRGFVLNMTNPKVLLFFIAVLPQFINPRMQDMSLALQTMTFGLLSVIATFICFSGVVLCAGKLSNYLAKFKQISQAIHIFSGIVFIGLAMYLVFSPI